MIGVNNGKNWFAIICIVGVMVSIDYYYFLIGIKLMKYIRSVTRAVYIYMCVCVCATLIQIWLCLKDGYSLI